MKKILLSVILASSFGTLALADLNVVTSFPILEDIAHNIGQDKVTLTSMIKRNQNPHNYEPSFSDIQNLYKADILIINGLNFEHWLNRATQQANFKGEVITASNGIPPIHIKEEVHHDHEHGHDHDHADLDPHVWQNPLNGIIMAENITRAFIEKDPDNQEFYEKNLDAYTAQLKALDHTIMSALKDNPSQPLKGIVLHDSFRYFSERYPMQYFPILDAHSINEPSVKVFAGIQQTISDHQIPVIFSESMEQGRFINTIVKDYKIVNGGQLISDTILEDNQPCGSYIGLLKCNLQTLETAFETVRSQSTQ